MRPSEFDPEGWGDPLVRDVLVRPYVVRALRRHPPTGLFSNRGPDRGRSGTEWLPAARKQLYATGRWSIDCEHFAVWAPDFATYDEALASEERARRALPRRDLRSPEARERWREFRELRDAVKALKPQQGKLHGFRYEVTDDRVAEWAANDMLGLWFDVDHVVPLMDDGAHDMKNLRLLCNKCHLDKSRRERRADRRQRLAA